ncbi:MAG: HD-GYP domain-containing protein [Spirochaetia bacterium]|nr:HD-GYP domain-containing protein [Spirochaetota bacterium]MDW8113064.1 HD-GYP domain-containing protein [Spirochaetia bacterium]
MNVQMKKIPVDELKPGMVFTRTVFGDNYEIVTEANTPITHKDITSLKKKGVKFVETTGDLKGIVKVDDDISITSSLESESATLEPFYKSILSIVEAVYTTYKTNKEIPQEKVENAVNMILSKVKEIKDKNVFISLIHEAKESKYLFSHITNCTILGVLLGRELEYPEQKLKMLATGLILMDIGMIFIPMSILERETKLTPEEYNKIKTHTVLGYKAVVQENNFSPDVGRVCLEHHERWDGTGYPRKLQKQQISEYARIASIVDTYEAMIRKRVYRDRMMSYEAMKNILAEGSTKFDPDILKVFIRMMSIYPVGSLVMLNNRSIAKVISSDPVSPFRPVVKVVYDEFGTKIDDGEIIRLSEEQNMYIVKPIKEEEIQNML